MKHPKKEKKEIKPAVKYLILKGFCYENAKGKAVYVAKKITMNSGHKEEHVLSLPDEAIKLGIKLKAIKAI